MTPDGADDPAGPVGGAAPDGSGRRPDRLEEYVDGLFVREDPVLTELRSEMEERGLPMIQVPARTGLLLRTLLRSIEAERIVEVGTLGGYSAIWMARALPWDGRLITMEIDSGRADLAEDFIRRAALEHVVEVLRGEALPLLRGLGPPGGYDAVFLDADKESYPAYLPEARRLLRTGGLLIADNAFWHGRVLDEPDPDDRATLGIREFTREVAASDDFEGTIVPVGDGVLVAVKVSGRGAPGSHRPPREAPRASRRSSG